MSGTTTAIMCDWRGRRVPATWLGRYPRSRIALMTTSRVAAPTTRFPDSTWDTVVGLTPARLATCAMVTRPGASEPSGTDAGSLRGMVRTLLSTIAQNDLNPLVD